MALARSEMNREHGALPAYRVLIDRFEARVHDGSDDYALDAQAWYGGDLDKFWVKVEGHGDFGGPFDGLEMQALWSHAIGPWFDAQLGVRYDVGPASDRRHLVLAVQGLAPYWIEVEGAAFLSEKGDLTAQFEAEHDVRISQKLILQPHGEIAVALQDVPEAENGSGLSNLELGLRLRYELVPEFAPYFGVAWSRAFGDTARMRRAEGEDPGTLSALLGLRFWF